MHMGFFTKLLQIRRDARSSGDTPWDLEDNGSELVLDAEAAEQLAMELEIDACIASHGAWRSQLEQGLRLRADSASALHPELLCEEARPCAVARWLAGPGQARHGNRQAFGMLAARHRYFHQQVAVAIRLHQAGQGAQARQIVNGGCAHASNQVVLLLKEFRRGPWR
jgi:hypothetical protein